MGCSQMVGLGIVGDTPNQMKQRQRDDVEANKGHKSIYVRTENPLFRSHFHTLDKQTQVYSSDLEF